MSNNLPDPYDSTERQRTSVRTADGTLGLRLGTNDYQYITRTHNRRDTLQRTFYTLLNHLVNELKRANIGPEYDPDAYEYAIANLSIVLPRRGGVPGSTATGINAGPIVPIGLGAGSVARPIPGHNDQSPNVPSRDKGEKSVGKVTKKRKTKDGS